MAMQAGVGLSRIFLLVGAGYTGTIMMRNGKLSDLLGELQAMVKGMEKSGEGSETDSDAIAAQVHRLTMEIRQIASSRQMTVINEVSGAYLQALAVPAAALGAFGYGYMWRKGLSFTDLMYVTKANMASVVSNFTKNLEQLSKALAATKRHVMQRIQNVDDKAEKQNDLSKEMNNQVILAREDISLLKMDLISVHNLIARLDEKLDTVEYKQDITNVFMLNLNNYFGGKSTKLPEMEQLQLPTNQRARNLLETKGLKNLAEELFESNDTQVTTIVKQSSMSKVNMKPRPLLSRAASARS